MRQDVTDAALRFAADRRARAGRFGKERIGYGAVRERWSIEDFEQTIAYHEIFSVVGF
jgi:hypothetical protein